MSEMVYKYYAVRVGLVPGVHTRWSEVKKYIDVPNPKYKGFDDENEAQAYIHQDGGPRVVGTAGSTVGGALPTVWKETGAPSHPLLPVIVPVTKNYDTGLVIWTDGSAKDNRGGWAMVITNDGQLLTEYSGPLPVGADGSLPTNNRAELYALYTAYSYISEHLSGHQVIICTDSELCINSLTKWGASWERNGWKTRDGKPVKNQDLFKPLYALYKTCKDVVNIEHVYAHTGLQYNERADTLANTGRLEAPEPVANTVMPASEDFDTWVVNVKRRYPDVVEIQYSRVGAHLCYVDSPTAQQTIFNMREDKNIPDIVWVIPKPAVLAPVELYIPGIPYKEDEFFHY